MSGKDPGKRRRAAGRKVTLGVIEDMARAAQPRRGDDVARRRRTPGFLTLVLVLVLWLTAPSRYEADDVDRGVMRRRWTHKLTGEIAAAADLAVETVTYALRWWVARGWLRLEAGTLSTGTPLAESIRQTNVTRAELPDDAPADHRRTYAHFDAHKLMAALDSNADVAGQQRAGTTARLVAILSAVAGGSRGHHELSQHAIAATLGIRARSTVSYAMSVLKDLAAVATGRHRYSTEPGDPSPRRLPDGAALTPQIAQLVLDERTAAAAKSWHATSANRRHRSTPRRRSLVDARSSAQRRLLAMRRAGAIRRRDQARRHLGTAETDLGRRWAAARLQDAQETIDAVDAAIAAHDAQHAAQADVAHQVAASLDQVRPRAHSPP